MSTSFVLRVFAMLPLFLFVSLLDFLACDSLLVNNKYVKNIHKEFLNVLAVNASHL